jgi:hypothetical protein
MGGPTHARTPCSLFKGVLYALLAANTAYFALEETTSKAIDAAAWLILIALFEVESRFRARPRSTRYHLALRVARLVSAAGVIAATIGYIFEDDALGALNSALWIAVVVLLEAEARYRTIVQRMRLAFSILAASLYGTLALLVAVWALRGQWFDAYDALLWLIAFAAIELELVREKSTRETAITTG